MVTPEQSTDDAPPVPTSAAEFFLEWPLYKPFPLHIKQNVEAPAILTFVGTLDAYCMKCERETVFQAVNSQAHVDANTDKDGLVHHAFTCIRFGCRTQLHFALFKADKWMSKIGQHPSLADLASADLRRYRPMLEKEDYADMNRAIGLFAHGIGAGSFVYLRRVFENQIQKAALLATVDKGWDQQHFDDARMDDKILLLRSHLPSFLVENRVLYKVLSAGIHSLTEDVCLKLFPVVRTGIELILDEAIDRKNAADRLSLAKKQIAALPAEMKSGASK